MTKLSRGTRRPGAAQDGLTGIAPGVEPAWVHAFVIEQRLLGVPGKTIGDALAVVQGHVTEAGQSAQEAFGDARDYARQVAPRGARRLDDEPVDLSWALGSGLGVGGMLLTLAGWSAWLDGTPVDITVGWLVMAALVTAALAVLHAASGRFLRLAVQRPLLALAAFALHFALLVAALVLLPSVVAQVPALATALAGVALLTVGTVLEWRSPTAVDLDDPVVAPGGTPAGRGRSSWLSRVTLLLLPGLTVLLLAWTWLVDLLS